MSTTLQRILVPVDGSQSADKAVTLALRLAREHKAELVFCHAVDYAGIAAETTMAGAVDLAGTFAALDRSAREILGAAAERAKAASVTSSAYKLEGRSATAIVTYAIERAVDAIVIGSRGLGGIPHLLLGSTAEGVLRAATVPVFVVRANSPVQKFGSIAVAVDDSEPSDAATAFAIELALRSDSRMAFVNVIESAALHDQIVRYGGYADTLQSEWEAEARTLVDLAVRHAKSAGITEAEGIVAFGAPSEEILARLKAVHADLIAIGTHGRRGLRRLMMGSVAEAVVRKSPVPVVVTRSLAELRDGRSASLNGNVRAELITT
jgi:nucleotide-binding universal stress UspA family protein